MFLRGIVGYPRPSLVQVSQAILGTMPMLSWTLLTTSWLALESFFRVFYAALCYLYRTRLSMPDPRYPRAPKTITGYPKLSQAIPGYPWLSQAIPGYPRLSSQAIILGYHPRLSSQAIPSYPCHYIQFIIGLFRPSLAFSDHL